MNRNSEPTDYLLQVFSDHKNELLKKKNVVAVGIGYKTSGGVARNELSIICSVKKKVGMDELKRKDVIPSILGDCFQTDVVETGEIKVIEKKRRTKKAVDRMKKVRPAPGGVSIGHKDITAGTLGCLVRRNGRTFILSNNHVLANSNDAQPLDPILQPGPYDGGNVNADTIARLTDFVPIVFEGDPSPDPDPPPYPPAPPYECPLARAAAWCANTFAWIFGSKSRLVPTRIRETYYNKVDAAIAEPSDAKNVSKNILEIGDIAGVDEAELGTPLKKSGRTTGVTVGKVTQINVTARVNYGGKVAHFEDQLMAGDMCAGGDSGSAVLDGDNKLVGLLFAGGRNITIISRIGNVFAGLELEGAVGADGQDLPYSPKRLARFFPK